MTLCGYIGTGRSSELAARLRALFPHAAVSGPEWAIACTAPARYLSPLWSDGEHVGFASGKVFTRAVHSDSDKLTLDDLLLPPPSAAWGRYAAGSYDRANSRIALVTDPLRLEHLFYAREETGAWIFASEMRTLLTLLGRRPSYHLERLCEVVGAALFYPLRASTPFQGVHCVEAGNVVYLAPDGQSSHIFYSPFDLVDSPAAATTPEKLAATLEEATRVVTADSSHVEVFLSGGIDSSAVAWAASRVHPAVSAIHNLITREDPGGEWEYAHSVASHLGISLKDRDISEKLGSFLEPIKGYDVPYPSRSSLFAAYYRDSSFSEDTVIVKGEGGDAVFYLWEYPWHVHDHLLGRQFRHAWNQLWEFCYASGAPLLGVSRQLIAAELWRRRRKVPSLSHRPGMHAPPLAAWLHTQPPEREHTLPWRAPAHVGSARRTHAYISWANAFRVSCETGPHAHQTFCIPLALPVVEAMLQAPLHHLADTRRGNRPLLRAAMAPHLPRPVVERWTKGDTSTTMHRALSGRRERAEELLAEGTLARERLIDVDGALADLQRAANGVSDAQAELMDVLMVELWCEAWERA